MSAADADGYVVYSTATNVPTTAVNVGNVTQYTLGGLVTEEQYNIRVRAYPVGVKLVAENH